MKSCIKLGGDLVNHLLTLYEIKKTIREGSYDILVGAGSAFTQVLDEKGINYKFHKNCYGVEERIIEKPYHITQTIMEELLLPIQLERISWIKVQLGNPKNVNFIGPISQSEGIFVNSNDDTWIHRYWENYEKCVIYAKQNSRKEHFNHLLVPKGNVEIRWVPKYS